MAAPVFDLFPNGEPTAEPTAEGVEVWPSPTAPLEVAFALGEEGTADGVHVIQQWRGSWWAYRAPHWVEIEEKVVRRWIYLRLRSVVYRRVDKNGQMEDVPWNPDRAKTSNVLDAYGSAVALIEQTVEAGTWLPSGETLPGVVATPAGLFNVNTRTTTASSACYFTTWSLPFSYDPTACAPAAWLAFLTSLWPDDPDTIAMIQEWLGYLVSGRTDLQKAMLLVGPKRSGKGTILRTAAALVGLANTAAPTLQGMTTQFGLQEVIGKTLLAIGDARLAGGTSTVVERLLSIIGQDSLTIDRKYRDPWTGRLGSRVMIASNEVPDFRDASGAIGSRFMVAKMTISFYDREDAELEAKLTAELPGILRWALDGLDRLRAQGRFTQSAASIEAREDMEESESPVAQFIEAACVVGPHSVPKQVLYEVWDDWRARSGYAATNIATFARALRAAESNVAARRGGSSGKRVHLFDGIGLRASYVGYDFNDSMIRNHDARAGAIEHAVPRT